MKNKNKNVAWATFRTATQVVAIMAVILVTLIACGKSDSGGSADNKNLIGTWKLESMTINGKSLEDYVSDIGEKISESTKKCIYRSTLTFLEKEVVRSTCELYRDESKQEECKCRSESLTYTLSGNTIALKIGDEAVSFKIIISENKLTLSYKGKDGKGKEQNYTETYVKQ